MAPRSTTLTALVEAASGSEAPVDELLRKLKVVSSRAGLTELDEWVQHELNGYPSGASLPEYRGPFAVPVLGHFSGPFGREMQNVPIPPSAYPAEIRDGHLWNLALRQGIAELEALASRGEPVRFAWPSDMIMYTAMLQKEGKTRIDPMLALMEAYQPVDSSVFIGILRSVRDRVLTLCLRLEKESPEMGEPDGPQVNPAVGRDVSIIMHGGTANFAVASKDVHQQATGSQNSFEIETLLALVRAAGVAEPDIAELREAVQSDVDSGLTTIGPKTQGWLRRWSGKAGAVVATSTVGAVTKILLENIGL